MQLDGVFMDLYGTLTAGDRQAVEDTCAEIISDMAMSLTARQLSIIWGERFFHALDFFNGDSFLTLAQVEARTLTDTMAELGVTVDPQPYVDRLMAYWRDPPLQPEVQEFLAAFRCPICIVSNADQADAEIALARHGVKLFDVVTSERSRSYKPDRKIFEDALSLTGWRRERVIHVGDSLHSDVGGALIAGIRSGWLNRAHRIHDIGSHTPDHEFADLLEFAAFVDGRA
jgi:2-haloacid dehalogenase/putative hydrolase of the HAD superfamily